MHWRVVFSFIHKRIVESVAADWLALLRLGQGMQNTRPGPELARLGIGCGGTHGSAVNKVILTSTVK